MPITDLLERNSKLYGDEIALVEINPEVQEPQRVTWKEYALIQPTSSAPYRREITWSVFDEKANRVAHLLLSRGIQKGQKVAILLMNCLEWLPIYFGILKAGAVAVPLNFRYTAQEIDYCLKKADVDVLFFGPEFIGRVEDIVPKISAQMLLFFVGDTCPSFAEDYHRATATARAPRSRAACSCQAWPLWKGSYSAMIPANFIATPSPAPGAAGAGPPGDLPPRGPASGRSGGVVHKFLSFCPFSLEKGLTLLYNVNE